MRRFIKRFLGVLFLALVGSGIYAFWCPKNPEIAIEHGARDIFVAENGAVLGAEDRLPARTDGLCPEGRCVLAIHGAMFSTREDKFWDPFATAYPVWRRGLGDARLVALAWESGATTWNGWQRAREKGHSSWYGEMLENASTVAGVLPGLIGESSGFESAICHSMGCQILLRGLTDAPDTRIGKVVMLNPAVCPSDPRIDWAKLENLSVMNIWTPIDKILAAASSDQCANGQPMVGLGGKPANPPTDWTDIRYETGIFLKGCRLCLSNPHRYFDHLYSYESDEFWPEISRFLSR